MELNQEGAESPPSIGELISKQGAGSKQDRRSKKKSARREKNKEVAAKDSNFLKALVLLPVVWVGFSATMKGLKDNADTEPETENLTVPVQAQALQVSVPKMGVLQAEIVVPKDAQAAWNSVRNAQNLASVYSSSVAAGSPEIAKAEGVSEAVAMLRAGVKGSGSFEDTTFAVPNMSERQAAEAMLHLSWDEHGMGFAPDEKIANHYGPPPATKANLNAIAKRNAQNLASVAASASATGSVELANAKNLDEAIALLTGDGVYGAPDSAFETTVFKVPGMDARSIANAREFLRWDDRGFMEYVDRQAAGVGSILKQVEEQKKAAVLRAEMINLATVAFIQKNGVEAAKGLWANAGGEEQRFQLITPYLPSAAETVNEGMPEGHSVSLSMELLPLKKVALVAQGEVVEY